MPSAVIAAYHYDTVMKTVEKRYHSGKVYQYLNVPEKVFEEMRTTIVKGIWFNGRIENKYPINEVIPGIKPR